MIYHSSKPVVCINGSCSITDINLDCYLDSSQYGKVITGGAAGVDALAEQWAKRHKIDWICYLPQWKTYGKRADIIRDQEMIDASDILVFFWDSRNLETKHIIDYAKKLGRKIEVYLIENFD